MKNNVYLGARLPQGRVTTPTAPPSLYKRANLALDSNNGSLKLVPVSDGYPFRVDMNADAQCGRALFFSLHKAPSKLCTCGFYAYTDINDALSHPQGGMVVIKIVASGKLLEYGKGYRYEHQRVESIELPHCAWCSESAIQFVVDNKVFLFPACKKHSRRYFRGKKKLLSFSRVEELANQSLPSHAPRITITAC